MLTAAALETSRIRLGTWVASPNYRHPVPFARELAVVDDISGGRLVLGAGTAGSTTRPGGPGWLGWPGGSTRCSTRPGGTR
ncbi:MAG TPA: LLM class flavin-dependent oxidoreductase [Kineosporiaceae bacterium]|nr:LLM class flavin-dependent oxidoreductase [Kineosporiaceae bacterium]